MAADFPTGAWGPAGPEESWLAGVGAVMAAAHLVATGRNITLTAPYFHDGSAKTSEQAWSLAPLARSVRAGGGLASESKALKRHHSKSRCIAHGSCYRMLSCFSPARFCAVYC